MHQNQNLSSIILPADKAREELRRRAADQTEKLTRSVARLTSCDDPCPEYREEVLRERALVDDLLYYQHCRAALEQCLEGGASVLRYRHQDGAVGTVSFRRMSLGRVRIRGL